MSANEHLAYWINDMAEPWDLKLSSEEFEWVHNTLFNDCDLLMEKIKDIHLKRDDK